MKGYEMPKSKSAYTKFNKGETKLRILTHPVIGWEDWVDGKPVRSSEEIKVPFDPSKPPKHFWSFVVWNYTENQLQIMHLTQKSIKNDINILINDSDWGYPFNYDIKVTRTGEGLETHYKVNPLPHKPLDQSIINAFYSKPIWLGALFDNLDPFDTDKVPEEMYAKMEYKAPQESTPF